MLIVLGALAVVGVFQYTIGGGWQSVQQEFAPKPKASLSKPFKLPAAMGPKDAKVKIDVYVDSHDQCHRGISYRMHEQLKPYQNKARVVFHDIKSKQSGERLAGYAIGCRMAVLVNGLPTVKVPWQKAPYSMEGSHGPVPEQQNPGKFIDWAVTPAGQKSLAKQEKAFAKERKARLKRQEALAAGQKVGPPASGGHGKPAAGAGATAAAQSATAPVRPKLPAPKHVAASPAAAAPSAPAPAGH